MARYALKEFEWRLIQPSLPNKPRSVPRVNVSNSVWVHQQAVAQKNRLETLVSLEVVEN